MHADSDLGTGTDTDTDRTSSGVEVVLREEETQVGESLLFPRCELQTTDEEDEIETFKSGDRADFIGLRMTEEKHIESDGNAEEAVISSLTHKHDGSVSKGSSRKSSVCSGKIPIDKISDSSSHTTSKGQSDSSSVESTNLVDNKVTKKIVPAGNQVPSSRENYLSDDKGQSDQNEETETEKSLATISVNNPEEVEKTNNQKEQRSSADEQRDESSNEEPNGAGNESSDPYEMSSMTEKVTPALQKLEPAQAGKDPGKIGKEKLSRAAKEDRKMITATDKGLSMPKDMTKKEGLTTTMDEPNMEKLTVRQDEPNNQKLTISKGEPSKGTLAASRKEPIKDRQTNAKEELSQERFTTSRDDLNEERLTTPNNESRRKGLTILKGESSDEKLVNLSSESSLATQVDNLIDRLAIPGDILSKEKMSSQERLASAKEKPDRERLAVPRDEPSISGMLDVSLSLEAGWKRRFITVVNDGLYIWTTHK
jgi:hypothetical protein